MHTIRCRNIIKRLNSQGQWEETVESEYYLNEPDKDDKLYRLTPEGRKEVRFGNTGGNPDIIISDRFPDGAIHEWRREKIIDN